MIARLFATMFLLIGAAGLCVAGTPQEPSERDGYETTIESYQRAVDSSNDNEEKALLYKKMGDLHASQEDFKKAAEEYIRALSLKKNFPEQERLRMAVSISWGDRLDEATAEFRAILKDDPNNNEARTHLARALSWQGRFDESLAEIEMVLSQDPGNRDALLIKANDLRWKGETDKALPLYRSVLEKQEDFDARLGYTHALFAGGDEKAARESLALLKPVYPYQEKELRKLKEDMTRPKPARQTRADVKFSHYRDTDGNDVDRYAASYDFPAENWKNLFVYIHTEAHDHTRRNSTNRFSGETRVPITGQLVMGAGLGVIRYQNDDNSDFLLGHLKADLELSRGSAGITLAREPLDETAELIEKRIRFTTARAYYARGLTERFSFYGGYGYTDYSDENNSRNLLLSLRYLLVREKPRTSAGYRIRYLDFNRQSFGGYFDPNRFLSHQIFVNTSFEKDALNGSVELFVGHQSFVRYGVDHNDVVSGGSASIGYRLTKHISVDANAEGGNFALQTATGFRYFLYGLRLSGVW